MLAFWINYGSNMHLKGDAQYGHIKNAWYVCRKEADHGGWHLQEH